jgi:hypothetical protein
MQTLVDSVTFVSRPSDPDTTWWERRGDRKEMFRMIHGVWESLSLSFSAKKFEIVELFFGFEI